jgi:tetratricopeptide (TPR) repeat protein
MAVENEAGPHFGAMQLQDRASGENGLVVMKPGFCIAAVVLVVLPAVSAPRAAGSEVDRAACDHKDVAACTRLIEDAGETASVRSIAHGNRGTIYSEAGDHDRARADFREAVRLDPGNSGVSLVHRCVAVASGDKKGMPVYGSGVSYRKAEAEQIALGRCSIANYFNAPACALVESACEAFANLPSGIIPDESQRCRIGMPADIKGTLVDIKRDQKSWSVGSTTYINTCTGLVDPSTGFAVLLGSKKLPSACRVGKKYVASGDIDYGFEPEFFLKVHSIKCER